MAESTAAYKVLVRPERPTWKTGDGRIILKWIFSKWDGEKRIGFISLAIEKGNRLLYVR
jgi:hypothetical protein